MICLVTAIISSIVLVIAIVCAIVSRSYYRRVISLIEQVLGNLSGEK